MVTIHNPLSLVIYLCFSEQAWPQLIVLIVFSLLLHYRYISFLVQTETRFWEQANIFRCEVKSPALQCLFEELDVVLNVILWKRIQSLFFISAKLSIYSIRIPLPLRITNFDLALYFFKLVIFSQIREIFIFMFSIDSLQFRFKRCSP